MPPISNMDDTIDSRDVIARIGELEDAIVDEMELLADHPLEPVTPAAKTRLDNIEELEGELAVLKALAAEAEKYTSDWDDGTVLVRDSYFKQYAMEFADDIGAITGDACWPYTCIDWDAAARDLRMDYTAVDFDGVTYWVR